MITYNLQAQSTRDQFGTIIFRLLFAFRDQIRVKVGNRPRSGNPTHRNWIRRIKYRPYLASASV